jgi:hypothetical protein
MREQKRGRSGSDAEERLCRRPDDRPAVTHAASISTQLDPDCTKYTFDSVKPRPVSRRYTPGAIASAVSRTMMIIRAVPYRTLMA